MHKCLTVFTGGGGHGHSTEAKLVEHIGRYSMSVFRMSQGQEYEVSWFSQEPERFEREGHEKNGAREFSNLFATFARFAYFALKARLKIAESSSFLEITKYDVDNMTHAQQVCKVDDCL